MSTLRLYRFAALATLSIWTAVVAFAGWSKLAVVITTAALALAFAMDNATFNAAALRRMSEFWRRVFLFAGVPIVVFGAQSALPVLIVAVIERRSLPDITALAFRQPAAYGALVTHAQPTIRTFGGMFLGMVALGFLLDTTRTALWLRPVERALQRAGRYALVVPTTMTLVALALAVTVPAQVASRTVILAASAAAIAAYMLLDLLNAAAARLGGEPATGGPVVVYVGTAAALAFVRLEAVSASMTLDSVCAAFAIVGTLPLMVAGMMSGEVWLRALTVHMVRANVLDRLPHLATGAHWAIALMASEMLASLYGLELPGWLTGCASLSVVGAATLTSVAQNRRPRTADRPVSLSPAPAAS